MDAALILIRYGEIGLKGKNRPRFERQLAQNIKGCLRGLPLRGVRRIFGRLVVEVEEGGVQEALERLQRVFGIVGASPVRTAPLDLAAMEDAVIEEVAAALKRREAKTFRIEARRPNKGFPLNSTEINRRLGAAVLKVYPELGVDLERPDLTVSVEVRDRWVYVYSDGVAGPGGLPVGVSNRALLLLSGGIDSPVAGWMAASRGIGLEAVHFHSFPFTSAAAQQKVMDLAAVLSRWTGPFTLHMVRFTDVQRAIQSAIPPETGITVMRRFMMRIASQIASSRNIPALVTGESVGQVASQTIESLAVIERVVDLPILRPVVALDKEAIVRRALRIGTYDISIRPYDDCCTLFLPEHPETKPRLERVEAAESALDVARLVAEALQHVEVYRWVWGTPVERDAADDRIGTEEGEHLVWNR